MFGPKSFSTFAYYAAKVIAVLIGIFILYMGISFLFGNYELSKGRYNLNIPVFNTKMEGVYSPNIIITILLGLSYYVIFFLMVSRIFKTLKAEVLFTKTAAKRINNFALLNLIVGPCLYVIIHYFIMQKTNYRDIHNLFLHFFIGFFVLFIAKVFKRGSLVQSENDLTI